LIRAAGVSVVFGRTVALDSIDLDLGPGIVGLFGPNGSGKSTLLRALAGLQPLTGGRITWRGRAVSTADESFRRAVGYAGHLSGLYAKLTLRENLELLATLYGAPSRRVDETLECTALGAHARQPVEALSAGLARRAAVARTLLHEPELLLLDEPYANLDDDAATTVTEAVMAWRRPERTAVIATHGAKRLKPWADAGVVLRRGRVAAAGSYGHARRFSPTGSR
jgi:heme ABC exporter ATP-binding subunit CcmA